MVPFVNCVALSVNLKAFTAKAQGCLALLNWELSSGEKAEGTTFEIQHSTNGKEFTTVGRAQGAATTNYSYTHRQAAGKSYYRLRMTDASGETTFSHIVPVTTDCNTAAIYIAPNPAATVTTVYGLTEGDEIKVTDMVGKVVAQQKATGATADLAIGHLAPAVYHVIISRQHEVIKADKITKQ